MAASAWSRSRASPLPKPLSTTCFTPWPSASTQPAATTKASVARAVPERIVHLLEVVQVDEHRRHLAVAALREVHCLLEAVIEQAPVGQTGERIVIGEEAHRVLAALARRDVLRDADHAVDLAGRVEHWHAPQAEPNKAPVGRSDAVLDVEGHAARHRPPSGGEVTLAIVGVDHLGVLAPRLRGAASEPG